MLVRTTYIVLQVITHTKGWGTQSMIKGHYEKQLYTCQVSRIMRESHACGSKISISRVQANFSRLTDKCDFVAYKPIKWKFNFQFCRKILQRMSLLIQLCHSYWNSWQKPVLRPGSKVHKNLWEYLQAFRNLWSSSYATGKSSVIIGRYRKIFGNSGYVKTKISRIGLKKSWQVYYWVFFLWFPYIRHKKHLFLKQKLKYNNFNFALYSNELTSPRAVEATFSSSSVL